ncbi:MAG: hypothetical protein AAFU54_16475 [Chloroflexota bacterium]
MIHATYHRRDKYINGVTLFDMPDGVHMVYIGVPDLPVEQLMAMDLAYKLPAVIFEHWHPTVVDAQLWMASRYGVPMDAWVNVPMTTKAGAFFELLRGTRRFHEWIHTVSQGFMGFYGGETNFANYVARESELSRSTGRLVFSHLQEAFKAQFPLDYNLWLNQLFIREHMDEKKPYRAIYILSQFSNKPRIALKWYLMQHYPYYPWDGEGVEVD